MTARRIGYRLLGNRYDYLLHLRPAEWPIVTIHTLVGAILAVGFRGLPFLSWPHLLAALLVWVVCLNGGTLAVNSAFDRDVADVAYLRDPPLPPRHLFVFGLSLMAFGAGVSWALPPGFRMAYGLCVVMSLLYSVPPARLKAIAGLDWMINIWGFGVLTPYAGWAATGAPVSPVGRMVLLGFCPLFGALYPLTQLYQLEEDRARGDSTMASVLGVRRSLVVAILCVLVAFALFAAAGAVSGWLVHRNGMKRLGALAVAALAWGLVLGRWLSLGDRIDSRVHQAYMYFALGAWAVTDAAILSGFG
jgi:4-hydroxybenzoate polyprenyltransferase